MKKEKTSSRKEKALETKKKIYESAEQLIRENGFDSVTVDAIVEMASVSKGSFYVHFESKDALVAALIYDNVKKLDLNYRTYLDSLPGDATASDILILLAGRIADVLARDIGIDKIRITYGVQLNMTINTGMFGYDRELYLAFREIICKGMQQGEFKSEIAADLLANHFVMALRGLTYEWCIRYPDFDLKDQYVKHFQILLTGIVKK
jgi:AcrR family transcriptional regulator